MNTPLNIIDGLEKLREAWEQSGGAAAFAGPAPEDFQPGERVAAAWIQAMEGRVATAGAPQRRLRRLARALANGGAAEPGENGDGELTRHGEALRAAIDNAGTQRIWPLAAGAAPEPVAELARRWQTLAPGLSALRAWRMIARLGAPAIAPEPAIRRFLWRLGAVDSAEGDAANFEAVAATAAAWLQGTQLDPARLEAMLRFHTQSAPGGGGHCAAKPRCGVCHFKPACAWARFHAAPDNIEVREGEADGMEPIRRRLLEGREDNLETAELLAAMLGGGAALAPARALLKRYANLRELERATVEDLAQVRGISASRAAAIKAALELGRRAARHELHPGDAIGCAEDVWMAYRARFRTLPQEHFVTLLMDAKHRVIGDTIVSRGSLTASLAHPREVFREAVRRAAAAVILIHNHPSGDPTPSPEDHSITTRLCSAGEVLGIRVLDHIVLGEDSFYSFKDELW